MGLGLRGATGNPAAPPYSNGPFKWDQFVTFTQGVNGVLGGKQMHNYYIDEENGSDGNDGKTPQTAFQTLEKCFGNTTGNKVARDDYSDDAEYHIWIAPGTYAPDLDLRLYGHGIHLHGLGHPGADSGVNITDSGDNVDYAIMLLGGANCTIENIQFTTTSGTNSTYGAIYAIAADNSVIRNCVFKNASGTGSYGIMMDDVRGTKIIGNRFGDGGTDYGTSIYAQGGADHYLIESLIQNNMIYSNNASAKGILIDNTCTTYANVIDTNWINLGKASGTSIGIDNNSSGVSVISNNYVCMASGDTPIESASSPTGMIGNHTLAGTTTVDPNEAAD